MKSHDMIGIAWLFEAGHEPHWAGSTEFEPSATRMNQVGLDPTRLQYWSLPCRCNTLCHHKIIKITKIIRYLCHIKFSWHFQNKYSAASIVKIKRRAELFEKENREKHKLRKNTPWTIFLLTVLYAFWSKKMISEKNFLFWKERRA